MAVAKGPQRLNQSETVDLKSQRISPFCGDSMHAKPEIAL